MADQTEDNLVKKLILDVTVTGDDKIQKTNDNVADLSKTTEDATDSQEDLTRAIRNTNKELGNQQKAVKKISGVNRSWIKDTTRKDTRRAQQNAAKANRQLRNMEFLGGESFGDMKSYTKQLREYRKEYDKWLKSSTFTNKGLSVDEPRYNNFGHYVNSKNKELRELNKLQQKADNANKKFQQTLLDGTIAPEEPKRGRGRPRGSSKKNLEVAQSEDQANATKELNEAVEKNIEVVNKESEAREANTANTSIALDKLTESTIGASKALDIFAAKLINTDVKGSGDLGSSSSNVGNNVEKNLGNGLDSSNVVKELVEEVKGKPVYERDGKEYWDPKDVPMKNGKFTQGFYSRFTGEWIPEGTQFLKHPSAMEWLDESGKPRKASAWEQEGEALNYLKQFGNLTPEERRKKLNDMGWDDYSPKMHPDDFRYIEQSQVPQYDVRSNEFKENRARMARDKGGVYVAESETRKNLKSYVQHDLYSGYLDQLDSLGLAGKDSWTFDDLQRATREIGNSDNLIRLLNDQRWQQAMYDTFLDEELGDYNKRMKDANNFLGSELTSITDSQFRSKSGKNTGSMPIVSFMDKILQVTEERGGALKGSPGTYHKLSEGQDLVNIMKKQDEELALKESEDADRIMEERYNKRKELAKLRGKARDQAKIDYPMFYNDKGRLKSEQQMINEGLITWSKSERLSEKAVTDSINRDYKNKWNDYLEVREGLDILDRMNADIMSITDAEGARLTELEGKHGKDFQNASQHVNAVREAQRVAAERAAKDKDIHDKTIKVMSAEESAANESRNKFRELRAEVERIQARENEIMERSAGRKNVFEPGLHDRGPINFKSRANLNFPTDISLLDMLENRRQEMYDILDETEGYIDRVGNIPNNVGTVDRTGYLDKMQRSYEKQHNAIADLEDFLYGPITNTEGVLDSWMDWDEDIAYEGYFKQPPKSFGLTPYVSKFPEEIDFVTHGYKQNAEKFELIPYGYDNPKGQLYLEEKRTEEKKEQLETEKKITKEHEKQEKITKKTTGRKPMSQFERERTAAYKDNLTRKRQDDYILEKQRQADLKAQRQFERDWARADKMNEAWNKKNRTPEEISADKRANKLANVNTALADLEMLTKQFQELTGEVYDSSRAFSSYNAVVDGTEKELHDIAYEIKLVENELQSYNRVMKQSSVDTTTFEYQLEKLEKQTKENMSASKALATHYDNLAKEFKELTGVTYVAGMSLDDYADESKAATPAAAALKRELDATARSMAKVGLTTDMADKQLKQFDNTAKGIDKHLTPTGGGGSMFAALAAGLTMLLAGASELDEMVTELTYQISNGEATIGWSQIVTGEADDILDTETLDNYSRSLAFMAKMAVITTTTLTETVSAATELAKAGVDGATAMFVLAGAMMIADMEGMDLNETLASLLGSGRAMGLTFDAQPGDTEVMKKEIQTWMDYFADILYAADATGSSVEDVLYGLRYLSPLGTTLGMDQDELIALSAVLGNVGLEGGKGARTLASGLMRLASPTEEAAAWMEQLGIEIFNTSGEMNSMTDILDDLVAASEAMDDITAGTAWNSIFGKEATKGFAGLMEQEAAFDELVAALEADNTGAYLTDRFATQMWKGTNGYTSYEMFADLNAAGMEQEIKFLQDELAAFEELTGQQLDWEYRMYDSFRENLVRFQRAMFEMEDAFLESQTRMYREMGLSQEDAMEAAQADWDRYYEDLIGSTEDTVNEIMDTLTDGWWAEMGQANPEFVVQASLLVGLEGLKILGTHLLNDLGALLGEIMPDILDWIDEVNERLEESGSDATFGEALTAYMEAFLAFKGFKALGSFVKNHRLLVALLPSLIDQYGTIEEVMGAIKTHMDDIIKSFMAWQKLMLGADLLNLAVNTIAMVAALWEAIGESDGLFGDNGLIEILKNFDGKDKKKTVTVDVDETNNTSNNTTNNEHITNTSNDNDDIDIEVNVENDNTVNLELEGGGSLDLDLPNGKKKKNNGTILLGPPKDHDNNTKKKKSESAWIVNSGLGNAGKAMEPAMKHLREIWDNLGIITKSITRLFVPGWWNAVALISQGLLLITQGFNTSSDQIDAFIKTITPIGKQIYGQLPEETQLATQTLVTACSQIDGLLKQITPLQAVVYAQLPEATQKAMLEIIAAGDQIQAVEDSLTPFGQIIWKDMSPLTQAAIIELEGVEPVLEAIAEEFPELAKLIKKNMTDKFMEARNMVDQVYREVEGLYQYLLNHKFTMKFGIEVVEYSNASPTGPYPEGTWIEYPNGDIDHDPNKPGIQSMPKPSYPRPGLPTTFGISAYKSRGLGTMITNNNSNDNRVFNISYNVEQGKQDTAFSKMVSDLRGV